MMLLKFDERTLLSRLRQISPRLRAAFAASCAERLIPSYSGYSKSAGCGDSEKLGEIAGRLWVHLEKSEKNEAVLTRDIESCLGLMPSDEVELLICEQTAAEDAVSALTYALRSWLSGDEADAAFAGRRAYEALDHFIVTQFQLGPDEPINENRVLSHPLLQAELVRQDRDVSEILASGSAEEPAVVKRLQNRAQSEAKIMFG